MDNEFESSSLEVLDGLKVDNILPQRFIFVFPLVAVHKTMFTSF